MEQKDKKIIDVTFVGHCDDEWCGLGTAEFDCIVCGMCVFDYDDLWYSQEDPNGVMVNTKCESCKTDYELTKVSYNEFEMKGTLDAVESINSILKEEIDKCGIHRDENDCDDSSEY